MSKPTDSSLEKVRSELLGHCQKFLAERELRQIERAVDFASQAHQGQKRLSGKPYIIHPLAVASRLSDLKLDAATIIAALLHDTLEDTDTSERDIKRNFGGEVLSLVQSVTKLAHIRIKKGWFPFRKIQTRELPGFELQIETLRKMMIAMSADIRVILIKLSDRLHNLETLQYLQADKRERIAQEALEIYAPITERLGMGKWRNIFEDLAFPYLLPEEFNELTQLAIPQIKDREKYLKKVVPKVKKLLKKNRIEATINYRAKKWYSLYKKLKKYEGNLSRVYDLIAMRIIVNSIEDCYSVLGTIHSRWKPLPGRIKDYIALPKPNGYQSIHTTVFCEGGQIVEFQIQTRKMNRQSEFGVAAHWIYAQKRNGRLPNKNELPWIKDFNRMQKDIGSSQELATSFRLDLFQDRIFVFTPTGDVKDLPAGSSPVDFAYSIHTDLGNHCGGAKVNGKITPLQTKLQNGDIVEILKRKNAAAHTDWLEFVKTGLARNQIRRVAKRGP